MGTARLELRHTLRQRLLAGYLGAMGFALAGTIAIWAFATALLSGDLAMAPTLLIALAVAHRLGSVSIRTARHVFESPRLHVEDHRLVIEDPTTLIGPQSIPYELVESVHVGPDVAGWLVTAFASRRRSDVDVIVGGGIRFLDDLQHLARYGCSAALTSSALHDGWITVELYPYIDDPDTAAREAREYLTRLMDELEIEVE